MKEAAEEKREEEEAVFRAAARARADVVSTFPINNEIISSEIRRVMSAIKIDPRGGYAQVSEPHGCVRARTPARVIYR